MIKSMTAYASVEKEEAGVTVSVDVRTLNNRFLDVSLKLPETYRSMEDRIKRLAGEKIARGRVEMRVKITEQTPDSSAFDIDVAKAGAWFEAVLRLKEAVAATGDVSAELLANNADRFIAPAETKDCAAVTPVLEAALKKALNDVVDMKTAEGEFLAKDMILRLENIEGLLKGIEAESEGLTEHWVKKLTERISILTAGAEPDPGRILQEAAIYADKSDISEEMVRASSHLNQFRKIMESHEPSGKKLNFLLQEFNREFNTIGSKTHSSEVSAMVVDAKTELEKLREQIQNVE